MDGRTARDSSLERRDTAIAQTGVLWSEGRQNEGQFVKEAGEGCIKGEQRGEGKYPHEGAQGKDIQRPDQQPANHSETELPICNVCNDLDRRKFDDTECTNASSQELNSAVQRGCPSCSLISKGISEFCSSLATEHREIYNIMKIRCISIILQQHAT